MYLFVFFFVFIYGNSFSQTHRFIYEFTFRPDSLEAFTESHQMTLDINPDEVKFYPYAYAQTDSLNMVRNYKTNYWDERLPALTRKINSQINQNFILLDAFLTTTTTDKMKWELHSETKKQDQYILQKATTQFGGRNWTAWFTKEIELQEGPYKFRGLPGLIFEIEDDHKQNSFRLLKSWKHPNTYPTEFLERFAGQKAIAISEKKLHQKRLSFYQDPLRDFRESFDPNAEGEYRVMNVKVTSKEQFHELTKMVQEMMRKENNPIELDKAIRYPEK